MVKLDLIDLLLLAVPLIIMLGMVFSYDYNRDLTNTDQVCFNHSEINGFCIEWRNGCAEASYLRLMDCGGFGGND